MVVNRRLSAPLVLLSLALVLGALLPASAHGAGVREYQLQYEPTGDTTGALMIVSALIDPQEPLPVTIAVPVPKGSTLLWAGEILGGDPAVDPASEYTVETVGDADVYTITAGQSYTVQLEIALPAPSVSGARLKSSVSWFNPGEEVLVTGAVVAEAGASDVETKPDTTGAAQVNDAGESLYPLAGLRVPADGTYEIAVEWKRPSGAPATANSPVLPIVLGGLVVAVVALVFVVARERTLARRASWVSADRRA